MLGIRVRVIYNILEVNQATFKCWGLGLGLYIIFLR